MGVLTSEHPKCMTEVSPTETILSRQLRLLAEAGISEVVMTTGYFDSVLVNYCHSLHLPLHFTFVNNPLYRDTNYIYSIYCAREHLQGEDILLMHGDLVFEASVLDDLMHFEHSCMKVSSTLPLPDKDFKAVVKDGLVKAVGIEFFDSAMEAQALYKLNADDWALWLKRICEYCENDNRKCYAEKALNEITEECRIWAYDVKDRLCSEIDTPEDLAVVSSRLWEIENRTVYMCFATDIIHSGHIDILKKAQKLGRVIVGVLSDEAIAGYRRKPLVPLAERMRLFQNLKGIADVIVQEELSYKSNLMKLKPTYVVHGNDWREGVQQTVRQEVVETLASYGGRLVEFPYTQNSLYAEMERRLENFWK